MKEDREGEEMSVEEKDGGREGKRRRHRGEGCKSIMDATESESENRDGGESFGAVIIISLLFIIK